MARSGADLDGVPRSVGAARRRAASSGTDVLTPLTIATWNVQEGLSEGCEKRDHPRPSVADLVKAQGIDVIALQEVDFDRSGRSTVLDDIEANTALRHIQRYPCSPSAFFPAARAGVAIASRYRITGRWEFKLPNPRLRITRGGSTYESYDKGVLACEIATGGGRLTLVSLHMFPFHMFERPADHDDFDGIWRALRKHLGELGGRPLVVAGDFNTADRGLLPDVNGRRLTGTTRGQVTHRGFAADDILFSPEVPDPPTARVLDTFSDHRLCLVELGE
ncbi:endonuclease/exonuclease/phosphatase family protein [Phytohabitans sp. ZYX-F-186]|uniref:Endonuclease/exonuclease/phosphatase family protein n=1 Tax=Phytohabitans maris TaxID=3071409 RepID=A0ABU0ZG07_9ACTN|nr:endonuclease/exonuclease/phosphatase family protein [Phytohabitans sp. ZYX-F-186]MDQ7905998.1 endonuclease/exonuclease/phosphatase family protein [Phytohabitans sp. ZYX-F-186]